MPTIEQTNHFFDFAARQLRNLIETHPDQFPMYTTGGKWDFSGESWTNWCEGFLGGQLWLLYEKTGDQYWREKAEHYSRLIEPRKTDRTVHDLGFLFWPTWKRWYDLTGDPTKNAVVIEAGRTMALRFKEKGQYLRSFLAEDSLFIDIMMNVGIVFYAAQETSDPELMRIATQHCLTTRKYLVRGDGSTAHEGIFDLETGEFLRQSTQQGWRSDSSWARGLAWAIYGFSNAYRMTNDIRFLQTAEQCARFYMLRTPLNGVPPNDWDEPNPALPYESSAAAIAAGGFLNLSELVEDMDSSNQYLGYAKHILNTLLMPEFLADQTPGWEGLLKHGIYHQRKGLGVDESVMWGDYFLMEALFRENQTWSAGV
ncbi:MAG: glycosyl hydrolase [Chloroflexi bacterium]|nr:glycosyl hydrolase [Chloroflexota bacterium]